MHYIDPLKVVYAIELFLKMFYLVYQYSFQAKMYEEEYLWKKLYYYAHLDLLKLRHPVKI